MKRFLGLALIVCAACSGASPLTPNPPAAPAISNIAVAVLSTSSAELTWTTDKESDSQAEYGTTTAYGTMSPLDSQPVTSHKVRIEGLAQGTSYHYRVRSRDKDGTPAYSDNLTFVTPDVDASESGGTDDPVASDDPVVSAPAPPPSSPASSPTAPVVLTKPAAGAIVSGTITVAANANSTDSVRVLGVQFKRNGSNLGSEDTTAPYSIEWNTTGVANGNYTLTAVARNAPGPATTSAAVTVTVSNNSPGTPDTTPPSVSISAPAGGTTASGTIAVTASATDNVGVAGVQFKIDGVNIGDEDTAAPYSVQWNTTGVANGNHSVTAVARDAAGNSSTSSSVAVTVVNDQAPPSVSITAPADGAMLSGTVGVTATASDDRGVAGVQFKLNGFNLGVEDTAPPYSVSWNTTAAANGSHTLTAVARDKANKTATSEPVSITVSNVAPPPPPPLGLTLRTDWSMDGIIPTSGDVPIPGSSGWNVVYELTPGPAHGWAQRVSDATAPRSPSGVYDFVYPAGMVEGNAPATIYYDGLNASEVKAEFWWKPSSPFDVGPNGNKIAFIFNGGGGAGGQQFLILRTDRRLHVLPEYPGDYRWRTPNRTATTVALGQWHHIEWYSNRVSGVLQWWLDGVLQGEYSDVTNSYKFDMFQFSPTWGGNSGARKRQTDHFWFDHVRLSTR